MIVLTMFCAAMTHIKGVTETNRTVRLETQRTQRRRPRVRDFHVETICFKVNFKIYLNFKVWFSRSWPGMNDQRFQGPSRSCRLTKTEHIMYYALP